MPSKLAECLLSVQKDTVVTMTLTQAGTLSFQVGDRHIDDIATGMPSHIYPVFDLYGKCERITLFNTDVRSGGSPLNDEIPMCAPAHFASTNGDSERYAPAQCEKGNLEVHEKELEPMPFLSDIM